MLGGITAAVIGVLTPLVIADLTRGTGRYNLAQGAVVTASGMALPSGTIAIVFLAQALGYRIGFYGLGLVGLAALALLWLWLPETRQQDQFRRRGDP